RYSVSPVYRARVFLDAVGELSGVELRHRRLERERAALVLQPGGPVDELTAGLDLDRHVGELEGDRLEAPDRLPELRPLARVGRGEVVRALGEPNAHRGDGDAPAVEDLEELGEALPPRAEQVLLRHRAVGERPRPPVRRAAAERVTA